MLQKAIQSTDFEQAVEIIAAVDNPFEGMQEYHITGIFDTLIQKKAFDVIDALIENGAIEMDIYEYDSFNKSIFASIVKHLSDDRESLDFLDRFVPKVQSLNDELEGKSLLSFALENDLPLDVIKSLVAQGCDLKIMTAHNENLIHQIVKQYRRQYDKGLQHSQFLMEEGLDIDAQNSSGKTPLFSAVENHRNEYIPFLMENGADPNLTDNNGVSPFFHAVANAGDFEKYGIMRQFAKPRFDQMTNDGETLLYEAIRMISSINDSNLNLLKMLLEDGGDIYQKSTYYHNNITAVDVIAQKPVEILQVVLDSGKLNVNQKDDAGNTMLHKVCDYDCNYDQQKAKETYRKVKLLLAAGSDANATNGMEETPMMLASKDNLKTKTVELLLSHK